MSSPPRKANASPMFTNEGLPLDHAVLGGAAAATDAGADGPTRRVDCRPPQLLIAPALRDGLTGPTTSSSPAKSKGASSDARRSSRSVAGNAVALRMSLIDDDDKIVDYFGPIGPKAAAPHTAVDAPTASTTSPWNVRERDVPTLPSFYPLEKSAVFVPEASSSAAVVAGRIASVLQARSIVAAYDAANAKVDCVSESQVEFRVRLYRGRGEYDHGLIVEVQRRMGFDLSYAQDMYAILDAAEGKASQDIGGDTLAPIYLEDTEGSGSEGEDRDSIEKTGGLTSLGVISDILCPQDGKVSVEGRDFALASLAALTSVDRMGRTAVSISNELLGSESYGDLRRVVLSNVGPSAQAEVTMLRSLEVLANVAIATHDASPLVELLSQDDHDILIKLIANIENARLNPRAADLSCIILKSSYESMPPSLKERLVSALTDALNFGGECHARLEMHSRQCLELMQ